MTTQQELLFTDLNALTEDQIEAGLAAGVWRENRPFVEQYLDQIRLSRADAAASAQGLEAIRSVVDDARAANFRGTIALIVAAGAMLALAHDITVMRADRGYFCLPEVDLGIPFTAGMNALIRSRLPIATAHEAMTTGRRYGGEDARAAGIVAATGGEGEVLDLAVARAEELAAKAGPVLGAIKSRLYAEVVAELTTT